MTTTPLPPAELKRVRERILAALLAHRERVVLRGGDDFIEHNGSLDEVLDD